jgi:hypothetical protein
MRSVPPSMTDAWLATAKTGGRRPVVRATVQRQRIYRFDYDTAWAQGGDGEVTQRHRTGHFASAIFGEDSPYLEIPNIISFNWERSIGQDAATATLTMLNTEVIPIGETADAADALDRAGFLTYNRGERPDANTRWGQQTNGWNGILVPDIVIKTYEGYGLDPHEVPAQDPHLLQSGVWMVDTVAYTDDGQITLTMRDLGRLLLDQVVFPPSVPVAEYPLEWEQNHQEEIPARDCVGGHWQDHLRDLGSAASSNDIYIGAHLTNAPYDNYVGTDGSVEQHKAIHAIGTHDRDTDAAKAHDDATFWRSTGQDALHDFVWWEFRPDNNVPVGAVRIRPTGGPYRVYISIHNGARWVGKKTIPYEVSDPHTPLAPSDLDIGADIPFVTSVIADRFFAQDYTLPRVYSAHRIRLTFTRLRQKEVGEHPFRAGLRELQIYTADSTSDLSFHEGTVTRLVGNYGDFTHIVKWMCAWAGWYWPPHQTGMDYIRVQGGDGSPATKDWVTFTAPDPVLPVGRVWGDFMKTGTKGIAPLTSDQFEKKPLMDVINYVRDLVGFLFYIDETGGVVWRLPNLGLGGSPRLGNYLSPEFFGDGRPGNRGRGGRTSEIITLDEATTLLDYSTVLDSKNVRERIFIANVNGRVGTVTNGYNPFPIGLTRTAGWTDQNFKTKRETRVMADLVAAQQMFSYKTGRVTIAGYPKIQVDDQVRVFERVTSETFYHHVTGISSQLNMADGTWTYDLTLHWLGENPRDAWVIDVERLDNATQEYLNLIGFAPTDGEDNDNNAVWVPAKGGGG